MGIKIGDKVRFLNSVGGGIVSSFSGKDKVLVEDEDGFEVPAFIRECVVVNDSGPQVHSSNKPKNQVPVEELVKKAEPVVAVKETSEGERINAFIAFLPVDAKAFQSTGYEAYFVNDSNYYLFVNYMNRVNNSWVSRYNGIIEPNIKVFMEEFGKEDLNALERICVQFVAFKKDKPYSLKNTVSVELRPDIVKFYKMHCFLENDYFEEDAMLLSVVREDIPEREILISAADLKTAMLEKNVEESRNKPQPALKKAQPQSAILEVDLHAHELLDNLSGLSNTDILNVQMNKFHDVLKQYAGNKGQKIVFIHGKGEGVLRKAIETELKSKYKRYDHQDASFREYGFGATMVIIK
jgi:Mismatch repair ATPase (MutS family)